MNDTRTSEETKSPAKGARPFHWLAGVATSLAIVACYGTILAIATLSSVGIVVTLHKGAWAGVISLLVLLALAGIWLGYRYHRRLGPIGFALAGAGLVLWAMLVHYNWLIEFVGLVVLAIATIVDWRLKKSPAAGTGG